MHIAGVEGYKQKPGIISSDSANDIYKSQFFVSLPDRVGLLCGAQQDGGVTYTGGQGNGREIGVPAYQ
jgi:hypothetical protein